VAVGGGGGGGYTNIYKNIIGQTKHSSSLALSPATAPHSHPQVLQATRFRQSIVFKGYRQLFHIDTYTRCFIGFRFPPERETLQGGGREGKHYAHL
jgi:hypothetical protein